MDLDTVTSVSNDLHQLIPQAHACVEEKVGLTPQYNSSPKDIWLDYRF